MPKKIIQTGYNPFFIGNYIGDFGINKNFFNLLKDDFILLKLSIPTVIRQNIFFLLFKIFEKFFKNTKLKVWFEFHFRIIPKKYAQTNCDYFFSHGFIFDAENNSSFVYADKNQNPRNAQVLISRLLLRKLDIIFTTTLFSKKNLETLINKNSKLFINTYPDLKMLEQANQTVINQKKKSLKMKTKILFVGADGKRKGLKLILSLMSRLKNDNLEFHIVSNVTSSSSSNNIFFYKKISNDKLLKLYESAHIFLFPTLNDTFGRVLIEAMSKSCVLVTSNNGPQLSITNNSKYGFNHDPNDYDSYFKTIEKLINNPKLIMDYMDRSIKNFNLNFSNRIILKTFKYVFK